MTFTQRFQHKLATHHAAHLTRRPEARSPQPTVINFCHNDYLGLSQDPRVIQAAQSALETWGVGSTGSAQVTGYTELHHTFEMQCAETLGFEAALIFSSGYLANLAVHSALLQKGDLIVQDKLCHASLLDGASLSDATRKRYRHLDLTHLTEQLSTAKGPTAIVSDCVFSMEGDIAPLPALQDLARAHQSLLILDDAHGLGVIGPQGFGSYAHFNRQPHSHDIAIYPLGKAIGSAGALVCGSQQTIDMLQQFARPYYYNTALPPAIVAASMASLNILQQEPQHHAQLRRNIAYFRQCMQALELPLLNSDTAIQPLLVGASDTALRISEALKQQHIAVKAIRPPTVPRNQSRLRITLSCRHTAADIDRLVIALHNAWQTIGPVDHVTD